MKSSKKNIVLISGLLYLSVLTSCLEKLDPRKKDPDLVSLENSFKASITIGYCASVAHMALTGKKLPPNVTYEESSDTEFNHRGIIHIKVDDDYPIPFNNKIGDIIIAGIWDDEEESGVLSIILGDVNVLEGNVKLYGIHTVPIQKDKNSDRILTAFAVQDIIIGEGQDTLTSLSMSREGFDMELERNKGIQPKEHFTAIAQNIWYILVDHNGTFPNVYDDEYEISGGGQLVETNEESAGIQYHALIQTKYNYEQCPFNPLSGHGFIQNIKANHGGANLGDVLLDFNSSCDGKASVSIGTGEYLIYTGSDVNLNFD